MADDIDITAWPVPIGAPAVLFGGTFDPPHLGHTRLADAARNAAMPGAWLVFVPAGRNPHKATGPAASDADRLKMVSIASRAFERTAVWTDEVDRAKAGEPSFWRETLDRLSIVRGSLDRVRFLIGADQAVAFHRWRDARGVLDLCEPVVMPRGEVASPGALIAELGATGFWTQEELDAWGRRFVAIPPLAVSSTAVRSGGGADSLDPGVAAFIRERGLYANR